MAHVDSSALFSLYGQLAPAERLLLLQREIGWKVRAGIYTARLVMWMMMIIGQPLFVTLRLHDSLPANRPFPAAKVTSGQAFLTMDRRLDQARSGPTFLKQPAIAQLVLDSLRYGVSAGHYLRHAWAIVPNHVHLLLTPQVAASKLLGSLKAAIARRANLLLQRTGQAFWQDESYDHLVRGGEEFRRIQRYIENHPMAACLAARPEQYAWSSAGRPARPPQANGLPHAEPLALSVRTSAKSLSPARWAAPRPRRSS